MNAAEASCKNQVLNAATAKPLIALPSFKEITDRTEGKAPQRIEYTEQPQAITVVVVQFAERHGVSLEEARAKLLEVRPELAQWLDG